MEMQQPTPTPTPISTGPGKDWMAIVSLVLGIIGLCAWLLPIAGCPLAIIGLVLGVLGLQTSQRTLAIVGIVLCALSLLGTIINALAGAYLGLSGGLQNI